VCEEEEGRIENQPREESPKRKKKLYVRSKRERRGQFKLIRPRSQTTINTIFFLLLLPSSFWVEGYFICSDSFFLYARKLSLVFFLFLFVRTNKAACPLYTYAHNFWRPSFVVQLGQDLFCFAFLKMQRQQRVKKFYIHESIDCFRNRVMYRGKKQRKVFSHFLWWFITWKKALTLRCCAWLQIRLKLRNNPFIYCCRHM
jgi:hypothetical protein